MSLLQDALRKAQKGSGAPGGGTPSLPGSGPFPPSRRNRRLLVRAAVLALILGVAAAMLLYRDRPSEPQPVAPQTAAPAARPALTAAASPVPPQAEPEPPVSKTSAIAASEPTFCTTTPTATGSLPDGTSTPVTA